MSKRPRKARPPLPPPSASARVYVHIAPMDVAMFRFLLEAEDNLGYMSVLNRWGALLKVTASPQQTKRLAARLAEMQESLAFDILAGAKAYKAPLPSSSCRDGGAQELSQAQAAKRSHPQASLFSTLPQ